MKNISIALLATIIMTSQQIIAMEGTLIEKQQQSEVCKQLPDESKVTRKTSPQIRAVRRTGTGDLIEQLKNEPMPSTHLSPNQGSPKRDRKNNRE